nr:DEAD/DEAH box helicase family protein [Hymenobacter sp. CRA2]
MLYQQPGVPLAVVEAKDNKHAIGAGMRQALDYAQLLDVPFAYSSNGDGFLEHDLTQANGVLERQISLDEFPSPQELWQRYCRYKGLEQPEQQKLLNQPFYQDSTTHEPRYYQAVAVNKTAEAVARGQKRLLLVMATGTGKTYTAFQIIHRLWKAGAKKRILFLADRNILIDQPYRGDFRPFGDSMTLVKNHHVDHAYEIYLALYQGLSSNDPEAEAYKQFSPGFFDLIVVDECHRGSSAADSRWRAILDYFPTATHLGLTATPSNDEDRSNYDYFGRPIYTYSLKQGIADGFLAPYKVVRVQLDRDLSWRPEVGQKDSNGSEVEDREYNLSDYDRTLVLEKRTEKIAERVTQFLHALGDRYAKTIVFCIDREHASRMRTALVNRNQGMVHQHPEYVMQLTSDQPNYLGWVERFTEPKDPMPVIVTTSKLLTTGVDTKTVKVIVLDAPISSLTEFKQIIGRGTRIDEKHKKFFFTILDFRNATRLFADPNFDGEPEDVIEVEPEDEDMSGAVSGGTPPASPPVPVLPGGPNPGPRPKVYVRDVPVSVLREQVQYYGPDGRLITESLLDYTRRRLRNHYADLTDFLARWRTADNPQQLVQELEAHGLLLAELQEQANQPDLDLFDLLCHVAYDQPPLTRRQRAERVRRRDYFERFGAPARQVLDLLLDKYTDEGPAGLESPNVLTLDPLRDLGTPTELVRRFGGSQQFAAALHELRTGLYQAS